MRTDLPRGAVADAPVVAVSPDSPGGVVLNGEATNLHEFAERLADQVQAADGAAGEPARKLAPIQRARLVFAVDEKVTWGAVARLAEVAATAGFDHIAFLFERPAAASPPPRSAIDDERDALARRHPPTELLNESREREARLIASKVTRSCDSVSRLLASVGTASSGDRAETLIRGISAALVECHCDVDMPSLRSLLWQLIGTRHPTGALEITLARDARRIDQPAGTPWREASQQLGHGQTVWLVGH